MTVRDKVHELVDSLPESELPAVRRYLETVGEPRDDALGRFLADAPEDDEPSTPEQDRAAAEARAALRRGERVSGEELKRTLLA